MVLTPLEEDFIGDLAQDDHAVREVFEFVRLHYGDEPAAVRRTGRDLLASWNARGWLRVVNKPPDWTGYQAATIEEVLRLIDEAQSLGADFRGADTWLGLTNQAFRDVEWLQRAS